MAEITDDQLDTILRRVLDVPDEAREAFLDETCGQHTELRALVDGMLVACDAEHTPFTPGGALSGPLWAELVSKVVSTGLSAGDRVASYRIVRPLGQGGMATVYLAERADGQFEQTVALKVLHRSKYAEDLARRFAQERQILASLHHPHIAHLIDGGLLPSGQPYVALEFVDGVPLDEYCDRERLNVRQRLALFMTVAGAVGHAHRNLVIHRDVKPSNILVTAEGLPKLLDFGIAKLLDESLPHAAPETRSALHPMTPEYASPEQVRGEPLTTASDIYQLGYLLYGLLAGASPYDVDRRNYAAMIEAICKADPLPPSAARSETRDKDADAWPEHQEWMRSRVAADIDAIVLKALRKEPEARYHSAESLADDIGRYLQGLPVAARQGSAGYRARKFLRRHRPAVAAVAAFLLLGASFSAFYTVQVTAERNRAQLQAKRAEEVTAFLVNLVELSDPERSAGRKITVREVLDRASRRIGSELAKQPRLQATLYGVFGQMYRQLAEYELAEKHLDRSVELYSGLATPRSPEVAKVRVQHSLVYLDQGRFADAIHEADAALTVLRHSTEDQRTAIADALTWRGVALRRTGDLGAARETLEDALDVRREVAAAGDPDLANTLVELGNVEYDAANFEEARRRYHQAIESMAGSGDNMSLAHAYLRVSFVDWELGEWEEAEKQAQRAYDIMRAIHGPNHPALRNALTVLNVVQQERGDFEAAEASLRESLRILTEVLGPEHPEIGVILNNLGTLRYDQERFREAADFYRQAFELRQRVLGPEHPITGMTLSFQAYALHMADDPRAGNLYRRALAILKAGYDDEHYYIANVNNDLGRLLVETGRFAEAEPMLRSALATRLSIFGEASQRTAQSKLYLAACLAAQGALAEARVLLDAARALTVEDFGEDSMEVAQVDLWMADWLWRSGETAAATALLNKTRSAILAEKDDQHWLARTAELIQSRMIEGLSATNPDS